MLVKQKSVHFEMIASLLLMLSLSHRPTDKGETMTTQTNPRMKEIQAIWQQYQGLYVVGGMLIGLLLFPFLELLITDLSALLIGLVPEAIGIGFTVFFLDKIYQRREIENLKKRLVREAGSRSNATAIVATEWMESEGWLIGNDGLLKNAKLYDANLKNAWLPNINLSGAILLRANLDNAKLHNTNLQNVVAYNAILSDVILQDANLENASFSGASLKRAKLQRTNLRGAHFMGADLTGASLKNAEFDNFTAWGFEMSFLGTEINRKHTILPDGTIWTSEIDMKRFTNPEHPDFWQPHEKE